MTEIPDDVMKAAVVAFNTAIDMDGYEGSYEVIARAIMAERERCARIADRCAANNKGRGEQAFAAFTVATEIGRAIRK